MIDAEKYRNGWQSSRRRTEKRRWNVNRGEERGKVILDQFEEIRLIDLNSI